MTTPENRGSKYLLIRDIERCPFVPKDIGYDRWNEDDKARMQKIINARKNLHMIANQYLSHEDRNVRDMALFINDFWGDS